VGFRPGNYLVSSQIEIVSDDSGFNGTCLWVVNDGADPPVVPPGYTFIYDSADTSYGRAPMEGVVTLTRDTNSIKAFCTTASGNHPIANGQMIALHVGDVN
jgi:hypothetical protein